MLVQHSVNWAQITPLMMIMIIITIFVERTNSSKLESEALMTMVKMIYFVTTSYTQIKLPNVPPNSVQNS